MEIEIFKVAKLYKFKLSKYSSLLNEQDIAFANVAKNSLKRSIDKLKYEVDTFLNEIYSEPEYTQSHLENWSDSLKEPLYFCVVHLRALVYNVNLRKFSASIENIINKLDSHLSDNFFEKMSIDEVFRLLEKASNLILLAENYIHQLKAKFENIFNDENYYGESIQQFENICIPIMKSLESICDLFDYPVDFDYELFHRECQEKINSDLAYQDLKMQEAIELMDPEDQEDEEAIQEMLKGNYFNAK